MATIAVAAGSAAAGVYTASAYLPYPGLFDWNHPALWRTESHRIALTFDDGPHPRWTPRLLDALGEAGARATFFVLAERAGRHADLLRRMAAEGHTIANHGSSHRPMVWLTQRRIADEIERCQRVIFDATGMTARYVRPPYGRRDWRFYNACRRRHLLPAMWSVDSLDWLYRDAARVGGRLDRVRHGDIVLLHDGQADASHTLAAVKRLVNRFAGQTAAFAPLSMPAAGAAA